MVKFWFNLIPLFMTFLSPASLCESLKRTGGLFWSQSTFMLSIWHPTRFEPTTVSWTSTIWLSRLWKPILSTSRETCPKEQRWRRLKSNFKDSLTVWNKFIWSVSNYRAHRNKLCVTWRTKWTLFNLRLYESSWSNSFHDLQLWYDILKHRHY